MTKDIRALVPLVKDIGVDLVTYYLRKLGWTSKEHNVYPVNVFTLDGQNEIVIPRHNDFKDRPYMIALAINFLATVEGLDFNSMVSRIRSINRDALRLRVFKHDEDINSIPFPKAVQVLENMKVYLKYAACGEDSPKPFFQRPNNIGANYVDGCRFGHTFRGSFGMTIESPIQIPEIQCSLFGDEPEPPFERRVMERVVRGVINASTAADASNVEFITENYRLGLNANMCEALSEVVQESDGLSLEYQVLWSPEWAVAEDLEQVEVLKVKADSTKYLDSAAQIMRDRKVEEWINIVGVISNLKYQFKLDEVVGLDGYDRQVVIQPVIGDYKGRNVHVELTEDDYKRACDIHRDQKLIKISGLIRKHGRSWSLSRYERFEVADV